MRKYHPMLPRKWILRQSQTYATLQFFVFIVIDAIALLVLMVDIFIVVCVIAFLLLTVIVMFTRSNIVGLLVEALLTNHL